MMLQYGCSDAPVWMLQYGCSSMDAPVWMLQCSSMNVARRILVKIDVTRAKPTKIFCIFFDTHVCIKSLLVLVNGVSRVFKRV